MRGSLDEDILTIPDDQQSVKGSKPTRFFNFARSRAQPDETIVEEEKELEQEDLEEKY